MLKFLLKSINSRWSLGPSYLPDINFQMPLSSLDKCKYKICHQDENENLKFKIDKTKYLPEIDKYWADFLRFQKNSLGNYIYKFQIYGKNEDRTLTTKEAVPSNLILQRIQHMPIIGNLDKRDLYYLLSCILNLVKLNTQLQRQYMQQLLEKDLLDVGIINYMKILARHPTTGLNLSERAKFVKNCSELLLQAEEDPNDVIYFNPDHIFKKSMTAIDPYELEYLKAIVECKEELNLQQYFYLANFIERLQQMKISLREEYLKVLNEKQVLPTPKFLNLLYFFHTKRKKINQKKLRLLLGELEKLMQIDLCKTRPPDLDVEDDNMIKEKSTKIEIDADKIKKLMASLMKGGTLNFSKLNDLKYFLKNLMDLSPELLEKTLKQLMASGALGTEQLKFIQNMILNGELSGDPTKRKLLMQMLNKVGATEGSSKASKAATEAAAKVAAAKAETAVKVKTESDAKAKAEADAKAKHEAEAKAKHESEAKAKHEAEAKAKKKSEAKVKHEVEAKSGADLKPAQDAADKVKKDKENLIKGDKQKKEKISKDKGSSKTKNTGKDKSKPKYKSDLKMGQSSLTRVNKVVTSLYHESPPPKCEELTQRNCKLNPEFANWVNRCEPPPPIVKCTAADSLMSLCPLKSIKRTPEFYSPECCVCTCGGMVIFP